MQIKLVNKSEIEQLRLTREILYTDLISQLKYLNDKKILMVKTYKTKVDNIDKDILALVSAGVKNGKYKSSGKQANKNI